MEDKVIYKVFEMENKVTYLVLVKGYMVISENLEKEYRVILK